MDVLMVLRAIGGLVLAALLIWVLARAARRWTPSGGDAGLVRMVDSTALAPATRTSPGVRLVVVDVDGKRLTLGVTGHQVNLLTLGEAPERPAAEPAGEGQDHQDFAGVLENTTAPAASGSVLSPATWRQTLAALRGGRR